MRDLLILLGACLLIRLVIDMEEWIPDLLATRTRHHDETEES